MCDLAGVFTEGHSMSIISNVYFYFYMQYCEAYM